jgi:hypothetical protein
MPKQTSDYVEFALGTANLKLTVDLEAAKLKMVAEVPDKNYLALGFGTGFEDSVDTLIFSANGKKSKV